MGKIVKKICNAFTSVLVVVLIVLAVMLAGVRLVGLQPMTVLSGSMEPEFMTGDLIYVKEVDYRDLQVGDVITFMINEDTVATHRIIEIIPDENDPSVIRYRTQGDANDSPDGSLVHYKNVVGSPVGSVPKMGYFANYIQNPPGTYIAISGAAVLLLLVFLPDLLFEEESKGKKKRKKGGKYVGKYQR